MLQRNDVIDMVFNASIYSHTFGLCIEGRDLLAIGPYRERLKLVRAALGMQCIYNFRIVGAPIGVIETAIFSIV